MKRLLMKIWSILNIIAAVVCVISAIWIRAATCEFDISALIEKARRGTSGLAVSMVEIPAGRPWRPEFLVLLTAGGMFAGTFLCIHSGHHIWAVILQIVSITLGVIAVLLHFISVKLMDMGQRPMQGFTVLLQWIGAILRRKD